MLKVKEELEELKKVCSHRNLRYRKDGFSGDWDREGAYWYDWYCPDCEMRLKTNQSWKAEQDILKKYPWAKEIDLYRDRYKYYHFYED